MSDRLSILTEKEIQLLYAIPKFDDEERMFVFELDDDDKIYFHSLKNNIPKKVKSLAKRHVIPKFVLQEMLAYCQQKKVLRPSYSTFQKIVAAALKYERNRLTTRLYKDADKKFRDQLDKLSRTIALEPEMARSFE